MLVVDFLGTSFDPATKYGEVVVPAKAGTQRLCDVRHWIPAFAGTTNFWRLIGAPFCKLPADKASLAQFIQRCQRDLF